MSSAYALAPIILHGLGIVDADDKICLKRWSDLGVNPMQGFSAWALVIGTVIFTTVFIPVVVRDYLNAPLALALVLIAAMSILWLIDRYVVELMSDEQWTYSLWISAFMAIALAIWGIQPYLRNF